MNKTACLLAMEALGEVASKMEKRAEKMIKNSTEISDEKTDAVKSIQNAAAMIRAFENEVSKRYRME